MEIDPRAQKFLRILDELVQLYLALQSILQKEKQALIGAEIKALPELSKAKETLLYKIRALDKQRMVAAQEWGKKLNMGDEPPRLLQLADKCGQPELAQLLREKHKTLAAQVQRVQETNSENEIYVQSAQRVLSGAMNEIKQTVTDKPTYGKRGQMSGTKETQAGNFVSKEA